MIEHPWRALFVGAPFVLIGLVYWLATGFLGESADAAGAAMLVALGVATGTMGYVLAAGSPRGDETT